ncbi:MAG TPA: serine/threonine-protein kinase [Candidatus Obscuribacterales bacterium]
MEILCTRADCPKPQNFFADLDDNATLKTVQQKYCITCGMPLILDGRYVPSKLLGRGGFGAAFLARDRRTPAMRKCVVKQFKPAGDLTPEQLQKAQNLFEGEGAILEQLGTHPQIPDLFAFFELTVPSRQLGQQDKFFYLVQEFIDGENLEEELAQKGKFSQDEVLAVLREILPVMKFVHEYDNNPIHRDIKPSNIMRNRNGRLYLIDFGAVKNKVAGVATGRSTGIYSMGYAPPEQMYGHEIYPSTDLYALAVTCIQLLTGKQPAELLDVNNNQWKWRNDAQVSDRLAGILDRMLLPAPNKRFQSAEDVLDALTSIAPVNPPQPVSPPSNPPTTHHSAKTAILINPLSTLELLGSAAFTGFEAGLLFIALSSLLTTSGISMGIWGMIMGGLIFAQFRRLIEKVDLLIIAGITLALVLFIPPLHNNFPIDFVIMVGILAGAGTVCVTALFRLVYKLLSNIL